jgi:uncharacterized protein (DUF1501 family)
MSLWPCCIWTWQTHTDEEDELSALLTRVNDALESFVAELKLQSAWDKVTICEISDFGRTLRTNGLGTDHAWGGINFVLGGAVAGGQILGQYPDLGNGIPLDTGRTGRLIPTLPWEAMWNGIAEWMDVAPEHMEEVLPNMVNFERNSTLLTRRQLFST